jgi:3-oxoacyl-[acyl-carrier protein] reductase/pteridine reductase
MAERPLRGKAALVTGGARRIGREIALELARAGADVAITYLSSQKQAQQTLVDLAGFGVRALVLRCDVREAKSARAAVAEVVRGFGGLDILVNNAAAYETVAWEKMTAEQWDSMFAANARGPFLVTQAATAALKRRRGRVINLGSLGGLRPWPSHAHYCASKAALGMLTQVMARALAPRVAVNCVAPGMIETGDSKLQAAEHRAFLRKIARKTPMQRAGTPEEVAAAVLFFATAPEFITGQTLVVDGGLGLV